MLLEDRGKVVSIGRGIEKGMFTSFRVIKAAHGIEFAEVKSENLHTPWVWGWKFVTDCDSSHDHGSESPDFIRMAPTPYPGLTWILSAISQIMWLNMYPLLLLVAICSLGCERRSATPGAHPQDVGYDHLLPDGKRWQYELVLPDDVLAGDVLRLEVRRFLIDEANKGIRGQDRLPVDEADHVFSGPAFKLKSSKDRARVSLQLLDLRDYSMSTSAENPIKLVGGINVAGQLAQLRCDANFVVGENAGISPSSQTSWLDNEIQILRFWSATEENEFTYDVCVRVVKAE